MPDLRVHVLPCVPDFPCSVMTERFSSSRIVGLQHVEGGHG